MRRLFPSRTRALLERQNEVNLPDVCDILEKVSTRLPGGAYTDAYPPQTLGVPCHVSPFSSGVTEGVVGSQVTDVGKWQVRLPKGAQVPLEGRVLATLAETGEVLLLSVLGILGPRSEESTRIVVGEVVTDV